MSTKQRVRLTMTERDQLEEIVRVGRAHARTINHAHILLLCDESGPSWSDERIATALSCNVRTVARQRCRFIDEGMDESLRVRRKSRGRPSKIEGATEAHLIALACSKPPSGRSRWTVRLLADQFVDLCEREGLERLSREAVRQMLKKTNLNLTAKSSG